MNNSPHIISPWSGRFQSGTAASPGLAGLTDSDTGIIISSANALGFVTGGTERWTVNSSGAFVATTDNAFDIGASGATRPRNIYIAGTGTFGGLITLSNGLVGTPQALSGAGAINVSTLTTALTTNGVAQVLTLADGTNGQVKTVIHDVDGGSAVLTPTTKTGFSTITFTNAGDTATLQFLTTRGWFVLSSYGAVIAP